MPTLASMRPWRDATEYMRAKETAAANTIRFNEAVA